MKSTIDELGARVWRPRMDSTDYHKFRKQYQASLTRLYKSEMSKADKELVEKFARDQKARGTGFARLAKLVRNLAILGDALGVPFADASTEDVKRVVHDVEMSDRSVWTRHDRKVILKQFFKWMNKGKYPEQVDWICTTIPKKDKPLVSESQLLTEKEVIRIIGAANHPRNKAFLAILAESGARIGEIGNLTIGQIHIDTNGTVLTVSGKTGRRRVRIISATPYLLKWLDIHPGKDNPSAPLWINIGTCNYHKQMSYEAIRKVIILAFKNAGIKKRCNPYIFRHSRASQLARHLTEFQMNTYFGWVQGSSMPGVYVHVSGKHLDEDILRINGMKPGEKPLPFKPQSRTCPRCKEINSPDALYCCKCAEIVDPNVALKAKMEESKKKADVVKSPFLEWLQDDPEMRLLLKRKSNEFREALYK